jgi:hypothetical protein
MGDCKEKKLRRCHLVNSAATREEEEKAVEEKRRRERHPCEDCLLIWVHSGGMGINLIDGTDMYEYMQTFGTEYRWAHLSCTTYAISMHSLSNKIYCCFENRYTNKIRVPRYLPSPKQLALGD